MRTRNRGRRLLVATGFWAIVASAGLSLAFLPWLWWNGGLPELRLEPSRMRAVDGGSYLAPLGYLIRHAFPDWVPADGGDHTSFFFRVLADNGPDFRSVPEPRSTLELYEDGQPLGPAHSSRREIRFEGHGRFAHVGILLFFSASDNSDPRKNGREYTIRRISKPRLEPLPLAAACALWLPPVALLLLAALRWRRIVDYAASLRSGSHQAFFIFFLLSAFTAYAYSFSSLVRDLAFNSFAFLALISLCFLLISRRRLVFQRWMLWPAAFLIYCLAGFSWAPTPPASWTVGRDLLLCSFFGMIIFSATYHGLAAGRSLAALLVTALAPILGLGMFLQNIGFDLKNAVASFESLQTLPWVHSTWNQKYQETWLLMLTWSVVSMIATGNRRWRVAAAGVLVPCGFAIFSGYSLTAKVVLLAGVVVFLGTLSHPRLMRTGVALVSVGLLLFIPLLVSQIWSYYMEHPTLVNPEGGTGRHLAQRFLIWEYSRELIAERPLLGWGLGAAKQLPGGRPREEAGDLLADGAALPESLKQFPPLAGGHSHSLPLLIWLETGALGVVLAAGCLFALLRSLGKIRSRIQQSALLALAVSFLLTFGLNYPAWDPTMLMLTVMTGALVGSIHRTPSQSMV